ncbi:MAG: hypothetical protein IQL11_14935 [Bacteroidales bacterium]|nr:hypothetical protein [Bacteroidales bacterium]
MILFLSGCEYDLHKENFRDIQQPDETHQFDLNLSSEQDTIKVFNTTVFNYNINTYGLTMLEGDFSLGGNHWSIFSKQGSFTVSPDDYSAGYDTLSLVIFTGSGSGSLADLAGVEGYMVEKRWLMLIDGRSAPQITLSSSITEEGYLKISWPQCDQYNFHSYEISGPAFTKTVNDPACIFYVDSSYIGGSASYRVNTRVLTNNQLSLGKILTMNDPFPTLQFTDLGLDSLKIFWNRSKYKCRYKLERIDTNPDSTLLESSVDTFCIMLQPGLAMRAQYRLYTYPFYLNSSNTGYIKNDVQYHVLGQRIAGNWPYYGYNHLDRALYTNTYDYMECYDISSMTKLNSVTLHNLIYQGNYSCPTNSTKVATISSENIYVFTDKNLQSPVIIPHNLGFNDIDHFYLTDNDLIAILTPVRYMLIRTGDNKRMATINIDDYPVYSKWACMSTSKDGRYACIVTYNGLKLYNIEDTVVTNVYSDARSYRSVLFDINDPSRLMLTLNDDNILEIRNAADFELVKSIGLPTAQVLRNIDPESGYLLLKDRGNAYIVDLNTSEVVLKVRMHENEYMPQLYGNRLFTVYGYTLDISQYLPQ